VGHTPGWRITLPLIVLAFLSLFGGFIELPHTLGHLELFSGYLHPVLPSVVMREGAESGEWIMQIVAAVVSLSGVYVAYYYYVKRPELPATIKASVSDLHQLWFSGWGFDYLYNAAVVRPFVYLANLNKNDVVDKLYSAIVAITEFFNRIFSFTQSGLMRWYVMGIVIGAILILTLGLLS
jgi:NADH-quinone oxidoreductase subunit L